MATLPEIREAFTRILETDPGARGAALAELDASIRSEVISLLEIHDSSRFLPGQRPACPAAGERLGGYALIEKIGEGGMGVVFRARRSDGEFDRDVAIKLVNGRVFAPEAERRFIAERRILALLDHPNIVRMLDGGLWEEQRYLVMELVDGLPVTEFCRSLALAEKLKLFQKICGAVQYAHSNLIIHRDLSARNILVTQEGQPKILDFGIARLIGNSDDEAVTLLNPMTVASASPEQLRGERLTVASDIYALGLLLYEIVAGTNPRAGRTRDQALDSIPAPGINRDVDAIVLKTLEIDPGARYVSAADLSEDIGRFLESRPVWARAPKFTYRASRFVRRKPAVAIAILAVVAGAAGSFWQARRAHQQQLIAEKRFNEARALTNTLINDLQPKLAAINGTIAIRKELVEKALVYLEALAQDSADNPELLKDLIRSYVALARVSGANSEANTGNKRESDALFARAESLAATLEPLARKDADALRVLAYFHRTLSDYAAGYGRSQQAYDHAAKAVRLAEQVKDIRHGDPVGLDEMAGAVWALAAATTNLSDKQVLFERAASLWSSDLEHAPPVTRQRLALTYRNLASAYLLDKKYPQSLASVNRARDLDEKRLRENPDSPEAMLALSFDLGALGDVERVLHLYAAAIQDLTKNLQLRERVLRLNPDDRRAADRLAYSVQALALAEQQANRKADALRDYSRAASMYESLRKKSPLNAQSLGRYAYSNLHLAVLTGSCSWYRRAIQVFEEAQRAGQENWNSELEEARSALRTCRP